MKKIAIFSVFIFGLSVIVDKNIAGPIDFQNRADPSAYGPPPVTDPAIKSEDLHFALETLQYIIEVVQYFVRDLNEFEENSYSSDSSDYSDEYNMADLKINRFFNQDEIKQRHIPEMITQFTDLIKSIFGIGGKHSNNQENNNNKRPKRPKTTQIPSLTEKE